jgi:hypothetical protein
MKKLLLSFAAILSFGISANAQSCTTNQAWADTTSYGVIPDTVDNFPGGSVNQPYSTDLNFKVPNTVTEELAGSDPLAQGVIGSPIQGFVVDSVVGLPNGFDFACNSPNCSYSGGSNGCANIFGTTATSGSYDIDIYITATVLFTVFTGLPPTPIEQSTSFTGYKIVIGTAGQIEQIIAPLKVVPNPARNMITIDGITSSMKATSISISNIEGKEILSKKVDSNSSNIIDLSEVKSGIYFVNVHHAYGVEKVKFVKE